MKIVVIFSFIMSLISISCSEKPHRPEPENAQFLSLVDLKNAPSSIQEAGQAVVMIESATGGGGSGSFISDDGLLMTNNHVLGTDSCSKEGCYVRIRFGFQRGQKSRVQEVFAEPVVISAGSDFSVFQTYVSDDGVVKNKVSTPNYLKFAEFSPSSLFGSVVYTVGHPSLGLKKFSIGEVEEVNGPIFTSDAFTLPGSSGSPVLNGEGQIVGITHHGRDGAGRITKRGYEYQSIGTIASEITSALTMKEDDKKNGLTLLTKRERPIALAQIHSQFKKLLNSRIDKVAIEMDTPEKDGQRTIEEMHPLYAGLKELEERMAATTQFSFDESFELLSQTSRLAYWIECRTRNNGNRHTVCPNEKDTDRLMKVAQSAFSISLITAGQRATYLPAWYSFKLDKNSIESAEAKGLNQILANASSESLNFQTARSILRYSEYGKRPVFAGTDVVDFVLNYQNSRYYTKSYEDIIYALDYMYYRGHIDHKTLANKLNAIVTDPNVSLYNRIEAETTMYYSGVFGFDTH